VKVVVTKANLKKLEKAMVVAAELSFKHADAVQTAADAFEKAFGEDVPEECFTIVGGNSKEEVGSLFNNLVNHGENMSGKQTVEELVIEMVRLMGRKVRK